MKKWMLFVLLIVAGRQAGAQTWYPLYEKKIPGNLTDTVTETHTGPADAPEWIFAVTKPMIEVYVPAKPNGTGLLIFPGGGYHGLSWKNEGTHIAKDFNEKGITCFIVKYRLPDHRYMEHAENIPLSDAVAAMRWVKTRAGAYHIDTTRIGAIGFSAGGHLAGSFGNLAPADARPAFSILVYPVVSMQPELVHAGSRQLLLGPNPSAETIARYSNEWQVTTHTPPTYITHAQDDKLVYVENSIRLFQALTAHQVPAEVHIVPKGDHGFIFGIPVPEWFDPMVDWLRKSNFIPSEKQ